ncbi:MULTISPECIES: hypothetical protein [unclassified Micromonospora]|uniref:hypothetical protein n=1 Tax=unclassified Micromonospora TaxID=2617518 RepID=UPI0033B8B529
MRARRLVAVATVAVGIVALSGCRAEPGVAAYVGDHRITQDAVTAMLDDLRAKNPTPPANDPSAAEQPRLPGPAEVTSVLVLGEVCGRVSKEKNYQPRAQVSPEQAAQQFGLSPDTRYVRSVAELYTCLSGVPSGEAVAPTDKELADVIAAGRKAAKIPANVSDEDAARQLDGEQSRDQLRAALATRRSLVEAVESHDVTVNPRYRPLEFPVLTFEGNAPAVSVPLGEAGSGTVTDVSTPDAVPSSPNPAAEGTAS